MPENLSGRSSGRNCGEVFWFSFAGGRDGWGSTCRARSRNFSGIGRDSGATRFFRSSIRIANQINCANVSSSSFRRRLAVCTATVLGLRWSSRTISLADWPPPTVGESQIRDRSGSPMACFSGRILGEPPQKALRSFLADCDPTIEHLPDGQEQLFERRLSRRVVDGSCAGPHDAHRHRHKRLAQAVKPNR